MTWDPLGYLRAVRDAELCGMPKLVLTMLLSRADSSGMAYPSIARLARDAGIGPATVRRALRELERAGWVRTRSEEGRSSDYQLTHPNHSERGLDRRDCPCPAQSERPPNQSERGPQSERAATPITVIARTTQVTTQGTVDDVSGGELASGVHEIPTVAERAKLVLDDPKAGRKLRPSTWPEVKRVLLAWTAPWKLVVRLGDNADRPDLRTILEALAEGYTVEALERCGQLAKTDPLFKQQNRPGPASFKLGVIGRLLSEPRARRPMVAVAPERAEPEVYQGAAGALAALQTPRPIAPTRGDPVALGGLVLGGRS